MRFTALEYMLVATVAVVGVVTLVAPTLSQVAAAFAHIAAVLPH